MSVNDYSQGLGAVVVDDESSILAVTAATVARGRTHIEYRDADLVPGDPSLPAGASGAWMSARAMNRRAEGFPRKSIHLQEFRVRRLTLRAKPDDKSAQQQ